MAFLKSGQSNGKSSKARPLELEFSLQGMEEGS
jgi:hypothetical protein